MPRYKYQCTECKFTKMYFHGINERIEICEQCTKNSMQKLLTNFILNKKNTKSPNIGEITKEFIEKNREVLENQKKETKQETYEPS